MWRNVFGSAGPWWQRGITRNQRRLAKRAFAKRRSRAANLERLESRLFGAKQEIRAVITLDLGDKLRRASERVVSPQQDGNAAALLPESISTTEQGQP